MNASKNYAIEHLELLFQNEPITGIGDTAGILASAAAGSLYLRLCTDAVAIDRETVGTPAAYTGYVANGVAVARSAAKWTITWNDTDNKAEAVNAEEEVFGERTDSGAAENIKYVEVWKNNTGTDLADRIGYMEFTNPLSVTLGVQPRIKAGKLKLKMF
ncbi:hypothetical protein OU798_07315 [Prolixibacteraceae bacterium Z1-6]|uniref:Uncharacterized protein n=1 Tax=Draconibacterium aestuarii TaxID=2998507 RepID=A0A9X3F4C0_9BACT|nr:hypothetical protein [Prolixibacteraceae bacterium Z1-6]